MTRTKPYPGTQSIRRAVSVLKAFTERRPEWTLADLSAAVELNKTTAYRVLSALEHEGLVARGPDGDTYRLGPELIVLGSRALRTTDLRTVSRPELEALAREAEETVTLEVLVDGEVLILDEVKGPGMLGTHADVGTRWPAYATSTGKALLAALEEWRGAAAHGPDAGARADSGGRSGGGAGGDAGGGAGAAGDGSRGEPDEGAGGVVGGAAVGWEIPDTLAELAPGTITSAAELRAELARIRERGYAVAHEELQPGYSAVGAAVRNHEGRGVAAIGVGGPAGRFGEDRIAELGTLVRGAADRISARLGAQAATEAV